MKINITGPDWVCECAISPVDGKCYQSSRPPYLRWSSHQIIDHAEGRGYKVELINGDWNVL